MRRAFCVLAFGVALAIGSGAVPGEASAHGWRHGHRHHGHHHYRHHHGGWWGHRVVVGVAPPYWGWPYPPPWVGYPPQVREAPGAYIERPDPPVAGYWYYCESAGGYYPRVPSCPEPWVKVPPRPE
ncbi:MAG: hypothetical protein ABFS41_08710 [Myxococcota bacterium]